MGVGMKFLKLIFIALSALIILAGLGCYSRRPCFKCGNAYTFYCGTSSEDCKIVTVSENPAAEKLLLLNVCGESTDYETLDIESFLKKLGGEILITEELSDSVNYYCRANLPYSVNLYGKTVNLHISVRENNVKVASPIIFGGY